MKFQDIQGKTERELHDLLAQKRDELRELRFKASEGQLKDVRDIRDLKKTIARILTAINADKKSA